MGQVKWLELNMFIVTPLITVKKNQYISSISINIDVIRKSDTDFDILLQFGISDRISKCIYIFPAQ